MKTTNVGTSKLEYCKTFIWLLTPSGDHKALVLIIGSLKIFPPGKK